MSGGITLAAASAASAGLAISNAMSGPAAGASGSADIIAALTGKTQEAAAQRSSLLSTAGQSAGSPLSPGSVGGSGNLFGN